MEDLAHWLKNYVILSIFAYNYYNNNHNNYKGVGGGGKKRKSNNDMFFGFCLTFCKHDWQDKTGNKIEVTKSVRKTEQETKWKK